MSFLSPTSLFLCQLDEGASIKVVSWGQKSQGDSETSILLKLPTLTGHYLYTRIQHHSNPSPSPSSPVQDDGEPPRKRARHSSFPTTRAFIASGEDRLLAFSTNIRKRTDADNTNTLGLYYLFFLSEKRLKAYLNSIVVQPATTTSTPHSLEWAVWGPQQVRWIPYARTYGWAVCSRGMRFVCTPPVDFGMGFNSQVMLLDFQVPRCCEEGSGNPCEGSCCWGQCAGSDRPPSSPTSGLPKNATLVLDHSVLPNLNHHIFEEDVVSSLPYLQVISEEWLTDSVGFMMDEETIVSVKVTESVSRMPSANVSEV